MKNTCLVFVMLLFATAAFSSVHTEDKNKLKKVWRIQQVYFDSIAGSVDTTLAKFRMIPASDSVFYLHDGKAPKLMYWNWEEDSHKIVVYNDKDITGSLPFIEYLVQYVDDQNLILTLDITNRNMGVKIIEYRLVPDPDFFNQN